MSDSSDLNISLEPHLQDALKPLEGVLPDSLLNQLKPYLEPATSAQSIPTIPYSLLHSISQWSRTPEGLASLKDQNLSPHAYTMISLLAGTTTSPERKFPAYTPTDPHEERKREYSDKKAVTTVVNGLLSVGGSGAATWWAADKVGWKPEWKVLLSLLVAAVVAASETILYIIWESRRTAKSRRQKRRLAARHKKDDSVADSIDESSTSSAQESIQDRAGGLRQRAALS